VDVFFFIMSSYLKGEIGKNCVHRKRRISFVNGIIL